MPPDLINAPLFPFAVLFGVIGVALFFGGIFSFFHFRYAQSAFRLLAGLLLVALGALAGTISVGMLGYRALTRENVAAHITVTTSRTSTRRRAPCTNSGARGRWTSTGCASAIRSWRRCSTRSTARRRSCR